MTYFYFNPKTGGIRDITEPCIFNSETGEIVTGEKQEMPEIKKTRRGRKAANENEKEGDKRKKISDTVKKCIEEDLVLGRPVKEITEDYAVSNPTVYIIKARLVNEGKISA